MSREFLVEKEEEEERERKELEDQPLWCPFNKFGHRVAM